MTFVNILELYTKYVNISNGFMSFNVIFVICSSNILDCI